MFIFFYLSLMDIRNPFATLASAGFVFDLSIPRATSFRAFDNIHHLDCYLMSDL